LLQIKLEMFIFIISSRHVAVAHRDEVLAGVRSEILFHGTELVVFRACKTALATKLGQVQSGEGVFGLHRALRILPSLCASEVRDGCDPQPRQKGAQASPRQDLAV